MDYIKKDIHMCHLIGKRCSELTIDEDFNIPDAKGDIEKIIAKQGRVTIDDVSSDGGKLKIRGTLYFQIVYLLTGENEEAEFYHGTIAFEDIVNLDYVSKSDKPEVKTYVEDFAVEMINSRKFSVRALLSNCIRVYESDEISAICGLSNCQGVECLSENMEVTRRPVCCQDIFHIKEELPIPQNKPNIEEILWSDVSLRNMEFRAINDGIRVTGCVEIFAIYKGQEDHLPVQYVYVVRNINEDITLSGVSEDMICDVRFALGKGDVAIKEDSDGEDRIIGIDYLTNVFIKLYEGEEIVLLKDAYSPQANIEPVSHEVDIDNLIIHNRAKTTVTNRRKVDESLGKLMQICHVYGDVLVDDYWHDGNLHISGIIKACVLYVAAGNEPISALCCAIPYEYQVELGDDNDMSGIIAKDNRDITDFVEITPSINELSANMINGEEVELKVEINLDIVAFARNKKHVITDIEVSPVDHDKKGAAPGVVGYIASEGDTLWSLARKYYSTTDSIRKINALTSDEIKEGDRLIIMKS